MKKQSKKDNIIRYSGKDRELLDHYELGWNDAADGKPEKEFDNKILQTAYNNGWVDFKDGDELRILTKGMNRF